MSSKDKRFITVAIADTNGLLRGQKIAAHRLPDILKNGLGMAPAQLALDPTDEILPIAGVTDDDSDFHDSILKVDEGSRRTMPFERAEDADIYLAQFTGDAEGLCPRSILNKQLAYATEHGLNPKFGFEQEFTLFNETSTTIAEKGFDNLLTATPYASHDLIIYQSCQSDFYAEVADMCGVLGIKLDKMHEEIGGGFMECCIEAGTGLEPVDQLVMLRNFLKVLATRRGQTITYMPRWSEEADSQSSHIHLSIQDDNGCSLFYDADREHQMSERFLHFLGGVQRYLPAMMLIFAPTVNSWRRFAEGTFAPPAFTWGIENRTSCFRVVGDNESSMRFENRLPGSDANPYLTTAALLAAGLSGMQEKLAPTAPTIGNGYQPGTGEGESLPKDMQTAISALADSAHAQKCLGEQFVDAFVSTRTAQLKSFAEKTLIDERKRFFELG
jgi:glutamine synthetase